MNYDVKKLAQAYENQGNKDSKKLVRKINKSAHDNEKKQSEVCADICERDNANLDTYAYTDNGYIELSKKLNALYDVVDSISISEKFLSGD